MDIHKPILSAVTVFVTIAVVSHPVFAGLVCIYGGDFSLPIPAEPTDSRGWMADAVIDITEHHVILDLDVGLSLSHTSIFDLQIFLQSPSGTKLCLNMYNPYDEFIVGQNYKQTIFDDEADTPIEQASPPFTGRFKPRQPANLSTFDLEDSYGLWRLKIYDAFYYDTGTLQNVELTIRVPEPATAILLILGAAFMRLHKRRTRRNHT